MFDIVSEEILKEKNIEDIFVDLKLSVVHICKKIKKKEDLNFELPRFKKTNVKVAYLLYDASLIGAIKDKDAIILLSGGDIKSNTSAINNKSGCSLYNPIGNELCFDEGLAEISKQNNKIIYFNINEIRTNQYKAIKQMNFIIPLLKSKKIEMRFVTMARKKCDLVDHQILESFLNNFSLEKETIKKFLNSEN